MFQNHFERTQVFEEGNAAKRPRLGERDEGYETLSQSSVGTGTSRNTVEAEPESVSRRLPALQTIASTSNLKAIPPFALLAPRSSGVGTSNGFASTPEQGVQNGFQGFGQGVRDGFASERITQNGFQSSVGQGALIENLHGVRPRISTPPTFGQLPVFGSRTGSSGIGFGDRDGGIGSSGTQSAPPAAYACQKPKGAVIDLTEEDDDDVVVVGQSTRQTNEREEVCYGTLKNCEISAHTTPTPAFGTDKYPQNWPPIPISLKRGAPNSFTVCVTDPSGIHFGCVDISTAQALAPLMDLKIFRIQARLCPRPKEPGDVPGARVSVKMKFFVNVYGPEEECKKVGVLVSQKNVFFQMPYMHYVDPVPVKNPHYQMGYAPRPAASQVTYVTRSAEEVRADVNNMFDGLNQAETLPELDPDPRIKTPLIKHQKQGLYFLTLKERERPEDTADEKSSLWKAKTRRDGQMCYYHVITGQQSRSRPADVLGGILADMMGLGKTLQILSLVVHTLDSAKMHRKKSPQRAKASEEDRPAIHAKTTLLISPLSTIANWEEQIATHVEAGALSYYVYHGSKREQDINKLAEYDMIVTTYSVVANEYGKYKKDNKALSPLQRICFFRIVLDEAHMIREQSTLQSKAVIALHAQRRWAVTGTPVQNKLDDLAALIKFLRVKPFDEKASFNQHIALPIKNASKDASSKECFIPLRLLVDSVTLRRLKDRIDLPARVDQIIELDFSPSERELYDATVKQSSKRIDLVAKSGHVGGKHYVHVLQMILRLRLICAHGRELLGEDDVAGLTSTDAIDVDQLEEKNSNMSAKQAYQILSLMKEANEDTCHICQKKVNYAPDPATGTGAAADENEAESKPDIKGKMPQKCTTIGYLTPCAHMLCKSCLPQYTASIGQEGFQLGMHAKCPLCELYTKIDFFELKWDEMAEYENGDAATMGARNKTFHYRGPSTKVTALLQALMENRELGRQTNDHIKSVVFSCWTMHMDLIEIAFKSAGIKYVRLDGRMSRPQRNESLRHFREDDEVEVILISLMAGGLGLNLTAACRVYVMEPQFNPAAEAQAVDRIHRLGQKRPVATFRYIMKKSFEEKILELQKKKTDLANMTMGKKMSKDEITKQRLDELRSLFD